MLEVLIKTPETEFMLQSKTNLTSIVPAAKDSRGQSARDNYLGYDRLFDKFRDLSDTEYYLEELEFENLQSNLFIPFKEITAIKKRIIFTLNDSREYPEPFKVPALKRPDRSKITPTLAVLISSIKDLDICQGSSATLFFQLPSCFKQDYSEFIELFVKNKKLIPWFPSLLIGTDYTAAVDILEQARPERIVTNNTGIAYEANKRGIPWIAGPYLNLVNSFSLLCLKEKFNCVGAFISNEISKSQIKRIIKPDNFQLYYSIYHPILLMTSRQCLLRQVTGCEKDSFDQNCIQTCTKSSAITNLKGNALFIKKDRGDYHSIYNQYNFLNTDIVTDLPDMFSSFLIDLRNIKTETKLELDKIGTIRHFENFLKETSGSPREMTQLIHPTTKTQYQKGV